jgi:hypothetical protein
MNKFIIGDLIHIPQGFYVYQDQNKILGTTTNKPIVATYLGKEKYLEMHKIEVYGFDMYLKEDDIDSLHCARQDVYQTN